MQPMSALTIRRRATTGARQQPQPAACAPEEPVIGAEDLPQNIPSGTTNPGQNQGTMPQLAAGAYHHSLQQGAEEGPEDGFVAEEGEEHDEEGSPVLAPVQQRALPPRTPQSAMRARSRLPAPPDAPTPIGNPVRVATPGRLACCHVKTLLPAHGARMLVCSARRKGVLTSRIWP